MTNLMSMEDLFYGPTESTWILPTREERAPRYSRERMEYESPQRRYRGEMERPPQQLRPVDMRYMHHHARPAIDPELRPVERRPRAMPPPPQPPMMDQMLRPVERLAARVHTVPEPVPVNLPEEAIRKVVEVPVPTAMPPPTQVIMPAAPAPPTQVIMPAPAPPTQVITAPPPAPPPPVEVVVPAPSPPVQIVAAPKPRSVSPPRAIIHHPIEMKVPMCCEKCAKKVKERLLQMEGVENVITDQYNQKVTVHGRVDPSRVIERVKRVKKRSAFWDMTVDYSENYRRARAAEDAAIARESAKAATVKAEQVAEAKAMAAPIAPPHNVVVTLPQEPHGPQVTAILPPQPQIPLQQERVLPYVTVPNVHSQRYVSPPKGYRQEFFHGPQRDQYPRPDYYHDSRRH